MVWVALLVAGGTLLVVQVKKKLESFQENPIVTNIDVDYRKSLNFPAIAICNINQFRSDWCC